MCETFTQIIFPPLERVKVEPKPVTDKHVNYWIVGSGAYKSLYIQCPICYNSYQLTLVSNEDALKSYIEDYPEMYFNAAIRECPDHETHGSKVWHRVV